MENKVVFVGFVLIILLLTIFGVAVATKPKIKYVTLEEFQNYKSEKNIEVNGLKVENTKLSQKVNNIPVSSSPSNSDFQAFKDHIESQIKKYDVNADCIQVRQSDGSFLQSCRNR